MVASSSSFFFFFSHPFLLSRDLFFNLFSFLLILSLSQAAAKAKEDNPPPADHPSPHVTTDTELANATPRIEGNVATLLHKADAPVESVVDLIGGTPLVRLRRSVPPEGAVVLAKLESLQPNSSVKDR